MDVRNTLAASAYAQARPQIRSEPSQAQAGNAFADAVGQFAQTMQEGEAQARAAMTSGADPHSLVTALAQTELAVETAVTVRDRVVEAYQEILRMPV
jgi:flagellar hook-basal body complex protein FliE